MKLFKYLFFSTLLLVTLFYNKAFLNSQIDSLSQLALMYYEKQEYKKAIEIFKKIAQLDPKEENTYFNLGICWEELGKLDNAALSYALVLKLNKDDEETKKTLNSLLPNTKKEIKDFINFILTGKSKNYLKKTKPYSYFFNSKIIENPKNFKEWIINQLIKITNKKINKQSNNIKLLVKKAIQAYKEKNYSLALTLANKILIINPNQKVALKIIDKIKKYQEKIEKIKNLVKKGEKLFKSSNYKKAFALFAQALSLDKRGEIISKIDVEKRMFQCLFALKQYEQALKYLRDVIKESPTADTFKALGIVLYKIGNYDEAINYLNKAQELGEDVRYWKTKVFIKKYMWIIILASIILLILIIKFIASLFNPENLIKLKIKKLDKYFSAGDWENSYKLAIELFRTIKDKEFLIKAVESLIALKKYEEAFILLSNEYKTNPKDKLIQKYLAKVIILLDRALPENLPIIRQYLLIENDEKAKNLIVKTYLKALEEGQTLKPTTTDISIIIEKFNEIKIEELQLALIKLILPFFDLIKNQELKDKIKAITLKLANTYPEKELLMFLAKNYKGLDPESLKNIFLNNLNIDDINYHKNLVKFIKENKFEDDFLIKYGLLGKSWTEQIISNLKETLNNENINQEALLKEALEDLENNNITEAISKLKLLEELGNQLAKRWLVLAYTQKKLVKLAYEKWLESNLADFITVPQVKEIAYKLARLLEETGKLEEALKLYNLICKVDIGYKDVFQRFEELYEWLQKNKI